MLMVHSNIAAITDGIFLVDRKFHEGLSFVSAKLGQHILTVHPRAAADDQIMDMVRVRLDELPYRVLLLDVDRHRRPTQRSHEALEAAIASSNLMLGQDFGAAKIARQHSVPYIMIVEYDLGTQIVVTTIAVSNPLRRLVRAGRVGFNFYTQQRADIRGAYAVHCNGYPIYEQIKAMNANRLLFLDSRMYASMVIDEQALEQRLASRPQRRIRLLYSGRYEAMKGVADALSVAIECQKRGLPIEMHFYGQGSEQAALERRAREAPEPGMIHVNDAVDFPTLMELAKTFDLFVCCHPQSDPSCTYVESFGAGLPIVGYANRMWRHLSAASEAGVTSAIGRVGPVVDAIVNLANDHERLKSLSRNARRFALEHCFEAEMGKRISAMREALERFQPGTSLSSEQQHGHTPG